FDIQGLVHLVAPVLNPKFNLLGIAGDHRDAPVIGVDVHVGAIRNAEGFGVILGVNPGGDEARREKCDADARSKDRESLQGWSHGRRLPMSFERLRYRTTPLETKS